MGYYDDNEAGKSREDKNTRPRSGKGYFVSGLVGAIIGAITITVASPYITGLQASKQVQTGGQVQGTAVPVVQTSKPTDIAGMVDGVKDAVVSVLNYQATDSMTNSVQEAGSGSGVIYKKVGNTAYIVTNNHVVEGAKQLEVTLSNGKKLPAKLVGTDQWLDLAVIQIDGTDITKVATLGDSDKVRAGDTAIAIGSPLGFAGSVTEGIISSKDREIPVDINGDGKPDWQAQVIQTDASINPGNSGGALLNVNGEVIGINSSKIAQQAVEGIGFAIPINVVKPTLDALEKDGQVKRPFMGVQISSLDELPSVINDRLNIPKDVTSGVLVTDVTPNSPASKAGLQRYDLIIGLDDQKIENSIEFRKYLYDKKKVGDKVVVTYYHNGQKQQKTIILDAIAN